MAFHTLDKAKLCNIIPTCQFVFDLFVIIESQIKVGKKCSFDLEFIQFFLSSLDVDTSALHSSSAQTSSFAEVYHGCMFSRNLYLLFKAGIEIVSLM